MKYLPPRIQRQKPIKLLSVALVAIAIFSLTLPAAAEEYPGSVSVKAILPENQVSNATYFDLRLSSGARQTVQIQISNPEDKPIEATVELNPASTGLNGTIVYNHVDSLDESARHPINEIARVRTPVVEVPAKASVLVDIDIDMPDEEIDGVILGGLRITADYPENDSNHTETVQEQGIQIKNKFAYVIGLKLTQNDSDVKPDFHLKSIRPGLVNYSTAVIVNIQNSAQAIAKNMPFSAQVFQKGSSTVLREMVKDHAEMAPNSNCDYIVDWGNTRIQPGTYRLLVRMQHEDRIWEWDEEFTVEANEAENVNNGALGLEGGAAGIPVWVYILGGLLLILIVLLAFLLFKLRSKKGNS